MDPFTEKLLERTRARRENLQKKMADRPTSAARTAIQSKRTREPLLETNHLPPSPSEEVKVSTSPSKRRCSDNKGASVPSSENIPPTCPSAAKQALAELYAQPQVATVHKTPSMQPLPPSRADEPASNCETPTASSVKSRMQKLASQRRYWDGNGSSPEACEPSPVPARETLPSPPKQPSSALLSSNPPVGRRGRLANLAATIGSWEDDLTHPYVNAGRAPEQPGTACLSASGASVAFNRQSVKRDPASSPRTAADGPGCKADVAALPTPNALHLEQATTVTPKETRASKPQVSAQAVEIPQSPGKDEGPKPQGPNHRSPAERCKSSASSTLLQPATPQDILIKRTVAQQGNKTTTPGGTAVKSFVERFGERLQANSPATVVGGSKTPNVTPKTKIIQEKLLNQNGASNTANLARHHKQERERELALIRGRLDRCSKSTAEKLVTTQSKVHERKMDSHRIALNKPPTKQIESISRVTQEKSTEVQIMSPAYCSTGISNTKMEEVQCSPMKKGSPSQKPNESLESASKENGTGVSKKELDNVIHEVEMNVGDDEDEMNSSDVINDLFSDAVEEKLQNEPDVNLVNKSLASARDRQVDERVEDDDCDEEYDENEALNISSMSLLAPLAETVGVSSPEVLLSPSRKNGESGITSPESPAPGKFQRSRFHRAVGDSLDSVAEDQNLLYSIDAYRSQRIKEVERPQIKQMIVRKEEVHSKLEDKRTTCSVNIKEKMKDLNNEINLQQTVIHQASQALNCCIDEEHGKGSQEEAEAERLLLVATEKRVALLAELNKLKSDGPQGKKAQNRAGTTSNGYAPSRGVISISDMRLPLKADFVCSAAQRPDSANYYFLILIRSGAETMVATSLASSLSLVKGDALSFSTTFTLQDVSSDFEINIEVYSLAQRRDITGPDKKKKTKSKAITPKRLLTTITKSNMHTPAMASPCGPNAVRTSNFALVGSHKITLSSIGNNKFSLDKVPFLSPLEGHIYLKLKCQVDSFIEEKGFLTMFEDVSGFGAWHRRWCVLSGYCISYWTYPDDEKRKNPIGRINLANCTNRKIDPANREFCARPSTFELITVRPQREDDRETLVSQCRDTLCVTKNWLSADTKDERNLWMQKLNQVLVDLRMWQPDSCYKPIGKP